jgi:hypothetical protein
MMSGKTLVIYNYYEKDEVYKRNFEYFLKFGILDGVHYVISINGDFTVDLVQRSNICYLIRPNIGYDFGAYDDVIEKYTAIDSYDYYFFVNCVVRGPFLPAYCNVPWVEPFIRLLSDDVKLVGATINILHTGTGLSDGFKIAYGYREPYSHVQTTMFVMDHACFSYLRQVNFFGRGNVSNKVASVFGHEILLSQLVLARGWNISCVLPEYRDVDYRRIEGDINPTSQGGNPWYRKGYFNRTLHPFDSIFFNTTSEIADFDLLDRIEASRMPPSAALSAEQGSEADGYPAEP